MATTKKNEPVKMTPTQMKKKIEALEEEIRVYKEDTAWCYMCGKPKKKNRENFYKYLDNELPAIDILIRTGGEHRLSNFMLYQASYAEYYFPETLFPDFNEKEFDKAILEFNKRNRRFGGQ